MFARSFARLALTVLLFAGTIVQAQYDHDRGNFYSGVRQGSRGGQYDQQRGYNHDYRNDDRGYDQHRGGIGPGKGALIGGAGGAALGAIFGGGLKG